MQHQQSQIRMAMAAAAVIMLVSTGLFLRPVGPGSPARNPEAAPAGAPDATRPETKPAAILIEAEDGVIAHPCFIVQPANDVGANRVLSIADGTGVAGATVLYRLAIPVTATYRLWLRVFWEDACGNSIKCRIGATPVVTVTDAIFGRWHWVDAGPARTMAIPRGTTCFELTCTEDGVHIDQIALLPDLQEIPVGILTPEGLRHGALGALDGVLELDDQETPREDAFDKYETPVLAPTQN